MRKRKNPPPTYNSIFVPLSLTFLMFGSSLNVEKPNHEKVVPIGSSPGMWSSSLLCVQTAEQSKFDFCLYFLNSLDMNLFLEL